jgi:hypothetical protein
MAGQYMWGLKKFSEFDYYEFLRPLWVSLIVFAPFWSTISDTGISYAAAAGAYQNGFFWKIVFDHQGQAHVKGLTRKPAKKRAQPRP